MEEKYLVIAKGTWDDDIHKCESYEKAREYFLKRIKECKKDYINDCDACENACHQDTDWFEFDGSISGWDEYQSYEIIKEPQNPLDELRMELDLADTGLTQYADELDDSCVCRDHIERVVAILNALEDRGLLDELKKTDALGVLGTPWYKPLEL